MDLTAIGGGARAPAAPVLHPSLATRNFLFTYRTNYMNRQNKYVYVRNKFYKQGTNHNIHTHQK
jgi:hypothetical protein